jgi:putative multiple sugar transport system substrate-binding protein
MKKSLIFVVSILMLLSLLLGACKPKVEETVAPTEKTLAVGIVLPTKDEPRWIQDETRFKDALGKAGYDVEILFSQGDPAKEKENVEALITKGIKVLIICPHDGAAAAASAEAARAAGVKVISYDRLITNTTAVDYYVTFDSISVGAAQAQYLVDKATGTGNPLYLYAGAASDNNAFIFFEGAWGVLQPKIADGTFVIKNSAEAVALQGKATLTRDEMGKIIGQITTNWDFNVAKNLAEANLTAAKAADKGVVFILAPNDGTARAIADAFAADTAVTKYTVTGQDAEIASVQYIIDGKQSMTVLKDVRTLVADAIAAAVAYLEGKTPAQTHTYNNLVFDVPAKPSAVVSVDKANVKAAIIDSGYYTADKFTGLDTLGLVEPEYPAAPEFIEVGSSISLTGNFGSLGNLILPGYEIAIEHINAEGGVFVKEYNTKIPLRLTYYDDESDPTKAVAKMETLYSEKTLTAYLGSSMHAAAIPIAEKNKVPYLGISFALYQIHQKGYKYLFSPFPKSPSQAEDVFKLLNDLVPEGERPTKVAMFMYNDDWGKEWGNLAKEFAPQYGYEIVVYEENPVGKNDWTAAIINAQAAGADALLTMPIFPDGSQMFKTMEQLGWTPKFSLVIRAPEGVNWGSDLGKTGDYVTIFPGWHYAAKFEGVDKLNARYQELYGRPADLLTGPAYACVQILVAAIEQAGTLDRDVIRDTIAAGSFNTVIGPVTFNADGTGNVLDPLIQWQNGKMELVWPAEQASANLIYPAPPFEER